MLNGIFGNALYLHGITDFKKITDEHMDHLLEIPQIDSIEPCISIMALVRSYLQPQFGVQYQISR